jgi:hypothetical protein
MNYLELWVDDHTLLSGDFQLVDESFDHDFGVEIRKGYELKNFNIVVYINHMDYDVTKAFDGKQLDYFKEKLTERFNELLSAS